ncbi:MAG: orotate phosphoribosyltransferase [Burkholderiaceae bacterium]|nr:orotate phosphoribosyltransferase [Burkholderiaceae bacterium]
MDKLDDFRAQFLASALQYEVLRFGQFTTKAGRLSPYFFNTGLFNSGEKLKVLAQAYAATLTHQSNKGFQYDMLFGPAYKGIVLAAATCMVLAHKGRDVPYCYNRKEVKDHGEGGVLVGAALEGRVVIIDDVISAGTSVKQSIELIKQAGATPAAVLIALDRMERGGNATELTAYSAVQQVQQLYSIPVFPIINLLDLLAFLSSSKQTEFNTHLAAVSAYRDRYGVSS